MFYVLFIASLFLPVALRLTQEALFGLSLRTAREILFFIVPLALVLILLCLVGYTMGVYVLFIPLMLFAFWGPQLAFICFFGWCERESHEVETSKTEK